VSQFFRSAFQVLKDSIMDTSAQVKIRLPATSEDGTIYYLCVKQDASSPWVHAGNETELWLQIKVRHNLFSADFLNHLQLCGWS
jgi:hypothetical protein